ncbi:MAG TPA: hypothetical protein VNJ08_04320 [Bacteriovoracaceae bacterium]|nr:hypothetical protein [Bacteriovoracaceae bacterium]
MDIQSDGKIILVGSATDVVATKYAYVMRFTEAGVIDLTFDMDGIAAYLVDGMNQWIAKAITIQADDKIVVVAERADNNRIGVLRLGAADGVPDTTFDGDGKMFNNLFARATGVVVLSTGQIVIAGDNNVDMGLIRFTSTGALDTGAGGGYGVNGYSMAPLSSNLYSYGMQLLTDGSILVGATPAGGDFGVAKFAPDGSMDAGFNGDGDTDGVISGPVTGIPTISDIEAIGGMAVLSDGKIFVAGEVDTAGGQWALALYTSAGALDTAFDTDGYLTRSTPFTINSGLDEVNGLVLQGTKSVVVGNAFIATTNSQDFLVARYTQAGVLDTTFGTGGKTRIDSGNDDLAQSVAIDSQGRIVVAGYSMSLGVDIAVARLTPDGALDTTFDTDGKYTFSIGSSYSYATGVLVDALDRVILTVVSFNGGSAATFAAARLTTAGALDDSFDTDGIFEDDFGTPLSNSFCYGSILHSDGSIVMVGSTDVLGYEMFAVVKVLPTGLLDNSFSLDGRVTTDVSAGSNSSAFTVKEQSEKILVGGSSSNGVHDNILAMVRYTAAGVPDNSFDTDGIVLTEPATAVATGYYYDW